MVYNKQTNFPGGITAIVVFKKGTTTTKQQTENQTKPPPNKQHIRIYALIYKAIVRTQSETELPQAFLTGSLKCNYRVKDRYKYLRNSKGGDNYSTYRFF